jgi:hypothetical protein
MLSRFYTRVLLVNWFLCLDITFMMSMNVRTGPDRNVRLGSLSGFITSNMSAIYSTVVPPGSGEPDIDLDATQPGFDVYQAYQRALTDEEVSLRALILLMGTVFSSTHPDISPSSSDPISYGARHTFWWWSQAP